MMNQYARSTLLIGEEGLRKLRSCRVAVFGLGGVGGYVVEALARSGLGALDLVDSDTVSLTNLNRQIYALHSTLGLNKCDVAAARVNDIDPDCRVTVHNVFYLPEERDRFDFAQYDYVVDAIDTVKAKLSLIEQAQAARVPIISAMGAGNKLDPTQLKVADIHKTSVCPLARVIRTECRKKGINRLKVVYSTEPPRRSVAPAGADSPMPDAKPGAGRRDTPGSIAFVPAAAGLIIASEVVKDLLGRQRNGQDQ